MNNIIFLDIDGVLTSEQNDIKKHEYYTNMHKVLHETDEFKTLKKYQDRLLNEKN